ncbi:MAG: flagellar basal body P-ring formation chaperone FlgA [Ignavibacteria bacterium]|nr:flagellar basal body P-ring formation chaperone FlgA [Ignavibacteria bacterium]
MLNLLLILLITLSTPDKLKDKIEEYLDQKLSGYQKYEFEISYAPKETDNLVIDDNRDFKISNDVAYIPVKSVNGKSSSLSFVTVKLKLFDEVFSAKRNINKKMILSEEDIEIKLVDVAKIRGTALTENDKPNTFRTKSLIKKGDVIISELLEKIPVIQNGDLISAQVQHGNVMVSIDAIARQEGCVNDVIRIASKDKKLFKAKVIDSKNVSIIE